MRGSIPRRFLPTLLLVLSGLLIGLLIGHPLACLCLATAGALLWQLSQSVRLQQWLLQPEREIPQSHGFWGEIFERIHALRKINKKRERQLQAVVREFREATHAFPDAVLVIDGNGSIVWFNRAANTLLGLREPDDLGSMVTNLIRDPNFAQWLTLQEAVEAAIEISAPTNDEVTLSFSAVQYRGNQRLLIATNISEQRRSQQVRQDFVANVSHELRTPLTVLLGYLEMIGDRVEADLQPAIQQMSQQGNQMQDLLGDLLELSRLQEQTDDHTSDWIDIPALLAQLLEQTEALSQGKHRIFSNIRSDLFLNGHQTDIESAFRNLLVNAVRYTPEGGEISVHWQLQDDQPLLTVKDSGVGIPQRDIPRLTERFYRVGSDRAKTSGGTGLGLAIVKHVLNAHQASLTVNSELGSGSSFGCIFPSVRGKLVQPGITVNAKLRDR